MKRTGALLPPLATLLAAAAFVHFAGSAHGRRRAAALVRQPPSAPAAPPAAHPRTGGAANESGPSQGRAEPSGFGAGPVRLAPGARVRFIIHYPGCGVQESGEGPIPVGLIGLDRVQVARQLPEARVVELTAERLILTRQLAGCPGDVATLAARRDRVIVYEGRPGHLGRVLERTDVLVRGLSHADRLKVEAGVVVPASRWREAVSALQAQ